MRLLVRSATTALYAEPGFLLYALDGQLMAQPVDSESLTPEGMAVALGLPVMGLQTGQLWASASVAGTLVTTAFRAEAALVWVDRRGTVQRRFEPAGEFHDLALSPDGSGWALNQGIDQLDLWLMDLDRGTLTRFETRHPTRSGAGSDYVPSIDGQRFLVTVPAGPMSPPTVVVTLNWPTLLER